MKVPEIKFRHLLYGDSQKPLGFANVRKMVWETICSTVSETSGKSPPLYKIFATLAVSP